MGMGKQITITILSLFAFIYASAQSRLPYVVDTGIAGCDTLYTLPEKKAEFPGGMVALCEFFNDNMKSKVNFIPAMAAHRILLRIKVAANGEILEAKIMVPTSPSFDKDVNGVIARFPNFIPAKYEGRNVCSVLILPIGYE